MDDLYFKHRKLSESLEAGSAVPYQGYTVTEVTTYRVATEDGTVVFECGSPEGALEECERLAASRAKEGAADAP